MAGTGARIRNTVADHVASRCSHRGTVLGLRWADATHANRRAVRPMRAAAESRSGRPAIPECSMVQLLFAFVDDSLDVLAGPETLTLPTAEAGGILVSSTGCLRVHEGLTGSPQAFGLDVSRPTVCSVMFYAADSIWLRILNPSSLRLLAALTSRSWNTPHCGHVHSRTSRFLTSGLRYPQSWQSWLDG